MDTYKSIEELLEAMEAKKTKWVKFCDKYLPNLRSLILNSPSTLRNIYNN